ncbi:MAG: heat-shock protein Hsp70 [Micrococcales bacterium]|nr:MAG: heat-shock protein Hsp70 [Micrococcales bacterium]
MSTSSDSYDLGIDLGTTYVAAAVVRDVRAEIVTLGDRFAVIPSVLFIKEDGTVLTGDPAVRRGMSEPARVVREFKRRVGDSAPIVVGQTPYSADALLAELLRFVYTEVTGRQGARPRSVVITHPANWGSYKIDVLGQAVRMADIGDVEMLTEPAAAAVHFAAAERLEVGQSVAVYDLGGGTFDAAVLRKAPDGFELLGEAEGIERLGGIDFDEAVFQHVVQSCESSLEELDPEDPTTTQALARLRQDCVSAKETLSTDTDVTIPVVLPGVQTQVRLTRAEFEAAIRPLLVRTVEALRRVIRTSGLDPQDLAAVLLAGGSSRIPLIAELVMADLGRPIAVDLHPKHTVALGAAIAAHQASEPSYQSAPPEYPAAADHAALTDATMTWQFPLAAEERFPLAAEAQSPLVADEPAAMPRDDNGSARPDAEQRPEPLEDRYERGEEDLEDEYSDEDWFVPSAAATRGDDNDPDAQRPARVRAVSAGLVALAVVFGVGLGARSMLGNGNDANGVEQQGASPEAAEGQAIADITAINLDGDRYTSADRSRKARGGTVEGLRRPVPVHRLRHGRPAAGVEPLVYHRRHARSPSERPERVPVSGVAHPGTADGSGASPGQATSPGETSSGGSNPRETSSGKTG